MGKNALCDYLDDSKLQPPPRAAVLFCILLHPKDTIEKRFI